MPLRPHPRITLGALFASELLIVSASDESGIVTMHGEELYYEDGSGMAQALFDPEQIVQRDHNGSMLAIDRSGEEWAFTIYAPANEMLVSTCPEGATHMDVFGDYYIVDPDSPVWSVWDNNQWYTTEGSSAFMKYLITLAA